VGVALDSRGGRTIVAGGDPAGQQLTVFETVSGRLLRTVGLRGRLLLMPEFGPDSTLTLDTMAARAYITTYDQPTSSGPARGYVNVVDTRGGLLLSAVSPRLPNTMVRGTGGFLLARTLPVAVTADESTGRAFVVNYSDVFARRRGSVTVVDGHSGRILGEVLTGKSPQAVAVDQSTGAAFAVWQRTKPATGEPAEPSHLSMLDGRDGSVVWTITLPYGGQPVVAPSLDRLFLVARSDGDARSTGHLTVINTRRRTVVRTLALDALGSCALLTLDEPRARAYLASGVAMPDAGGDDPARLRVLDARTGALLHTTILRGSPRGMAVDTRRGRIMVLLAHEGHGTRDAPGSLVILSAQSGGVLYSARVGPNPSGLALDEGNAQAYVTAVGTRAHDYPYWPPEGAGALSVVDTRSGVVRRTTSLGVQPLPPVVDQSGRRVVVLSRGGSVPRRGAHKAYDWRLMPGALTILEMAP